jgi:hypothetical protein
MNKLPGKRLWLIGTDSLGGQVQSLLLNFLYFKMRLFRLFSPIGRHNAPYNQKNEFSQVKSMN